MKEVAQEVQLDLWVCEHFKVLPTDDRFLKLSTTQKNLLWWGFITLPSDSAVRAEYWSSQKIEEPITNDELDGMRSLGYTEEQLERIKKQMQIAQESSSGLDA
jgi:hypothetical protein